jgi:transcriptional regulator with XRE-family HTH domain
MNSTMNGWEPITTEIEVPIPTLDGKTVARIEKVKVQALRNPKDGEIYLDGEALQLLDDVKARHMGLMLPAELKGLRETLGLTQKQISVLLQIGEKTWTRWETGRERPSRSMNLLLYCLWDRRIDVRYLKSLCPKAAKQELVAAWEIEVDKLAAYQKPVYAANEDLAQAA